MIHTISLIALLVVACFTLGLLVRGVWDLIAAQKQASRVITAFATTLITANGDRNADARAMRQDADQLRRDMAHQARMLRVAVGEATGAIRESMNEREDNAALGAMILAAALLEAPRSDVHPSRAATEAMDLIKAVIEERRRVRGDKSTPFGLKHTFTIDEEPAYTSDEEPSQPRFVRDGIVEPPSLATDPSAE